MDRETIIEEIQEYLGDYTNFINLPEYDARNLYMTVKGLLDLYNKEKEKNKELLKQLEEKEKEVVLVPEGTCFMMKPKNVISKDKIKAKIKEVETELERYEADKINVFSGQTYMEKFKLLGKLYVLKELLEEE